MIVVNRIPKKAAAVFETFRDILFPLVSWSEGKSLTLPPLAEIRESLPDANTFKHSEGVPQTPAKGRLKAHPGQDENPFHRFEIHPWKWNQAVSRVRLEARRPFAGVGSPFQGEGLVFAS